MRNKHIIPLACPKCKGELIHQYNEYSCRDCNISYPILEGVPCLISNINEKFKSLQKGHYERDTLKLDSIRETIDQGGFSYGLTLKAVKITKVINSIGIFPGADVLDIGCRDGRLLNKLKAQFQTNNYGMDISLTQMQENTKVNPFNNSYFVADAESLPFAKNSFDFVVCFDVLEHLPNYRKCIKEIALVLKENGRAIFYAISKRQKYTWNWFLRKMTGGLLGKGRPEVHQFEYFLSPEETVDWCKRCGFAVENPIYFHCFFVWAFDSLFLFVKNILGSILNRRKNIVKEKAALTNNSTIAIYSELIFIRAWAFFLNIFLPILEFFDSPWRKTGYSSGFFLQVKKR